MELSQDQIVHKHQNVLFQGSLNVNCHVKRIGQIVDRALRLDDNQSFITGPFSMFQHMTRDPGIFSAKAVLNFLQREVTITKQRDDEHWFQIGGLLYRFGRQEFCLVTGLQFGFVDLEALANLEKPENDIVDRLFPNKNPIHTSDISERIMQADITRDDAITLAYVSIIDGVILGKEWGKSNIPRWVWNVVQDWNMMSSVPWGTIAWSNLLYYIPSVGKEFHKDVKKISAYGMFWAIGVSH